MRPEVQSLLDRLDALGPDATRRWGTMQVGQMFEHVDRSLRVSRGELPQRWSFVGRLVGKLVYARAIKPGRPLPKKIETAPDYRVEDAVDFEVAKDRLRGSLVAWRDADVPFPDRTIHPFFGPLSTRRWHDLQVVHTDHHFRQFSG